VAAIGKSRRKAIKLNTFPGDILLQVFDFCRPEASETDENFYNWWHGLVHVCQRWRQLVFGSPCRLNLQLLCTRKSPVRKKLDCWPKVPIAINIKGRRNLSRTQEDNLLAIFEHSDRVCSVTLSITRPQLEKVVKMMLKQFPALTHLRVLTSCDSFRCCSSLPSEFLGGPASVGLRELHISGISPPALPSGLLSASDLVDLHLRDFTMTDHVSPEAMVARLSVMTKL